MKKIINLFIKTLTIPMNIVYWVHDHQKNLYKVISVAIMCKMKSFQVVSVLYQWRNSSKVN